MCAKPQVDGTTCVNKKGYAHCRLKPRCPWALVVGDGVKAAPYRVKLTLIHDGKSIVQLGSIDGYWLRDFWTGQPPDIWRWHSIVARKRFWDTVLANMAKVGDNLLSPEDRKRVRKAIHKVVPWVMKWEHKQAELFELEHDYKYAKDMVERDERQIAEYRERIVELQKGNIKQAAALTKHLRFMSGVAEEVKKLKEGQ
jgi:hypothetical protein